MASPSTALHTRSLVRTQVDFEQRGFQTGYLEVPYSRDRSGYGHIPIPIVVINNGVGPRVLLTGGNHGDEYEGPVALSKLTQRLKTEPIQGRLIIIPTLNLPAVLNASRTSPIDGGNLNRLFPGRRDGSITEMIAHYVETELFPLVDGAIDLHAGGASFDHLPTLLTAVPSEGNARTDYMKLVHAFAAPRALVLDMLGEDRTYSAAAQRAGIWFIGGEFGGGSHCDPGCLAIVEHGLRRVLRELGITPHDEPPRAQHQTRMLTMHGRSYYVFARHSGIFEPTYRLGDEVCAGQLAGRVFSPYAPWDPAHEVYFEGDGIVMCARTYADVEPGDCVAMLACDIPTRR